MEIMWAFINKEDVYLSIYIYTYTQLQNEILLSHTRGQNFAVCSNMNELGGHYAKSQAEKHNTVWYHLHVESKKYNILMNKQKRSRFRYREHTSGYQCRGAVLGGREEGTIFWLQDSLKNILFNREEYSQYSVVTVNGKQPLELYENIKYLKIF